SEKPCPFAYCDLTFSVIFLIFPFIAFCQFHRTYPCRAPIGALWQFDKTSDDFLLTKARRGTQQSDKYEYNTDSGYTNNNHSRIPSSVYIDYRWRDFACQRKFEANVINAERCSAGCCCGCNFWPFYQKIFKERSGRRGKQSGYC